MGSRLNKLSISGLTRDFGLLQPVKYVFAFVFAAETVS
nr:MAG TPA: hypothetical protein [Caudoviricetes sp.]